MRCVFRFTLEEEYIDKSPMALIKNLPETPPYIYPLSMDDVFIFLANVVSYYKNFFIVAFFTGMRFGEMAVCLDIIPFHSFSSCVMQNGHNFGHNISIALFRQLLFVSRKT